MLRIVYAMLGTGEVYRNPEADYEAPMVKRNAPRWIRMMKKHGFDTETVAGRSTSSA